MNIIEIFYTSDNIVKLIEKNSNKKENKVGRHPILSRSEYVTLAIFKQEMGFKTTLDLYNFVKDYLDREFPKVPTYQQFCTGMNNTLEYFVFVSWALCTSKKADYSWYYIVDSTPLEVCNNNYRYNSKIFKGLASSGKNMNGWFFGFKLNIIINKNMDIVSLKITKGGESDSNVLLDENFISGIKGYLVGDRGYIGAKKAEFLSEHGITLVTRTKKNMKQLPATDTQNLLLSKRQKVESVFSFLKHRLSIVDRYARSATGFFVGVFSAIVSYQIKNFLFIGNIDGFLIS
jgi:hypothetical protein